MATVEEMVSDFHDAADHLRLRNWDEGLWLRLLDEEVAELREASEVNDRVKIADAVADIVYVTVGLAINRGLPFDAIFAEVHRSNMTKFIPPVAIREDGKVIKGPNFSPPDIAAILEKAEANEDV